MVLCICPCVFCPYFFCPDTWKQISDLKNRHQSKKYSESDSADRGIIYDILTIFRAHHACCSIYICFVPEENYLKKKEKRIESTFVKNKNKKNTLPNTFLLLL